MTEKNYFLNIYNTMTGEFELVQVTKRSLPDLQADEIAYAALQKSARPAKLSSGSA